METTKRDPRGQGEQGELNAALWFVAQGASVFLPLLHTPRDYDLIVDWGDGPRTIQAKTSTCERGGRWEITVCTRGGNRSWDGVVKLLDPSRYDYLFVVVADGRRWLIPSAEVGGASGIRLGGPKYARFEIEQGAPLAEPRGRYTPAPPAGFPSGQRDMTVNHAAQPSQVRILPPP